ncbi:rhodanese-like domain-containing protein [Pseudactinotalea sp. Z1739]|uniref:rhodanese-like domain-containing protein n=1 Tax=Pseudactinotalea sp. Z1739 TaxID=3413028 RepID=UPI003C7AF23B
MAVVTGTPWDLALDQSAYPARARTPSSSGSRAPTALRTRAPRLFAARTGPARGAQAAPEAITPRAAYQDALHGRAVLVDIRPAWHRARDGQLTGSAPSGVTPEVVQIEAHLLITWLVRHREGGGAILVSTDGVEAAALAQALGEVDLARPAFLAGGFEEWRAAGLATG